MRRAMTDTEVWKEIEQYILHGILGKSARCPAIETFRPFETTGSICFVTGALADYGTITGEQERRLDNELHEWWRKRRGWGHAGFFWAYHSKAPRLKAVRAIIQEREARGV